jgi:hypothetical protein
VQTSIHFLSYLAGAFLEWEMLETEIAEKLQNTYIMINTFFISKIFPLLDNVETKSRAGQITNDNMAHAPCMLDT